VQGVAVERALVYVCSKCGDVAATPQIRAGRVFAAVEADRATAAPTELRVPEETEDLAYAWAAPDRSTVARWLIVAALGVT
jgi:hypothetical protein